MYKRLHVKYPLLLDFNETRLFWTDFEKNTAVSNITKIRPVGVVPRGRTDMTMLIVAFRNFANAPKIKETRQKSAFF